MNKDMLWGELGQLRLEFGIKVQSILSVNIVQQVNRHSTLELKVICESRIEEKDVLALGDAKIVLSYEVKEHKEILFRGICRKFRLTNTNSYKEMLIWADSESILLDRQKKTRTFQSPKKKFSDIAKVVLAEYKGTLDTKPDFTLPELIVQQNETDFAFLRRLANEHRQCLSTDCRKKLLFGSGKSFFQSHKLTERMKPDIKEKSVQGYIRLKENADFTEESWAFKQDVFTYGFMMIGVFDKIDGSPEKRVIKTELYTEGAVLYNRLFVVPSVGCIPAYEAMNRQKEFLLTGRVIAIKETKLRIQFSCDKEQKAEEAQWISYENEYGNYCYVMPDKGDTVVVLFKNGCEPIARWSMRVPSKDKQEQNKDFEPSTRLFMNHNKMLRFTPMALELSSNRKNYSGSGSQAIIQFDNKKGIRIFSTQNIVVNAEKHLYLQASDSMINGLDAIIPFNIKEKTGEIRYVAGAGVPPVDRMDDIKTGIGQAVDTIMNGSIKDEKAAELPEAIRYIQTEMPGGAAGKQKTERQRNNNSYPAGCYTNLFGSENCIIKVGSSCITASGKLLSVKAATVYQLGFLPRSSGGRGSSLGLCEKADYDDKRIVNIPVMKRNKKSLAKTSSLGKGAAGKNVNEQKLSGFNDMKRRALEFKAVKKKNRVWQLTYNALKKLQ